MKKRGTCRVCGKYDLLKACGCGECRCLRKSKRDWLCQECLAQKKVPTRIGAW